MSDNQPLNKPEFYNKTYEQWLDWADRFNATQEPAQPFVVDPQYNPRTQAKRGNEKQKNNGATS